MKKFCLLFLFLFLASISAISISRPARADELDDITKQINELQKSLEMSQAATTPLISTLENLDAQIASIRANIAHLEQELEIKRQEVAEGEKAFELKRQVMEDRVRSMYKHAYAKGCFWCQMVTADNFDTIIQNHGYHQSLINEDKETISEIVIYIRDLEEKKVQLANENTRLAQVKVEVDKQAEFYRTEIKNAQNYQAELGKQIADLSQRQNEILAARSGQFTASIGNSELADDYNASIKGFRESAPSGHFAVFAFGAHTHRKGMSQYGARGRARAGQNYKQILNAYYGKEPVDKDTGGSIKVSGFGEMDFETTYLYGIAEMPSSWDMEALKAQAVAARTYAYRYKQEGKEICTTESCQVFNKGKSDGVPESWKKAVDETKGKVLEDVVTYYASTHGGYASPIGWDTKDGSGGGDFVDKSWDKEGGSPWVYKAWYTQGYSPSSDKCGRSNPWLSPEEMADLVNAALVLKNGNGSETERVTPVTTSCWGGNPYSMDELRNVASKYGGISSANSVTVIQGNGTTNEVRINGVTLSGADFKKAFNVRAPGYLSIPQSGFAFFNIEKK